MDNSLTTAVGNGLSHRRLAAAPVGCLGLVGIVAVHCALALYLATTLNIWFNEAYTLDTTAQGWARAWSQAITFEEQAPLYFVLLALWRQISASIVFARLFSVLCTGLTVALSHGLSRRYLPGVSPLVLPLLVAINPLTLWAAVEIRLYAFSLLLSALLLGLFYEGYYGPGAVDKPGWRWAYGVTACVAIYTHYFLAILMAAQLGLMLVFRQRKPWLGFGWHLLGVALVSLPMGWVVLGQLRRIDHSLYTAATPGQGALGGLPKAIGSFALHSLPMAAPQDWLGGRLGILLGLLGLALAYRQLRPHIPAVWVMAGILLGGFGLVFTAMESLHYRHATPMFLVSLMAMVGLGLVGSRRRPYGLILYGVAAIALSVLCLIQVYSPLAKPGDYKRVGQFLSAQVRAGQPVLVYNQEVAIALAPYYHGGGPLVPLPQGEDFREFRVADFLLSGPEPIAVALAAVAPSPTTVWLAVDTQVLRPQPAFQRSFHILETYVQDRFMVVSRTAFYGTEVLQLTPK